MKTYEVILVKCYIVKIKAENLDKAKEYAELFTNDVKDISTEDDRKKLSFEIEDIDRKMNRAFERN